MQKMLWFGKQIIPLVHNNSKQLIRLNGTTACLLLLFKLSSYLLKNVQYIFVFVFETSYFILCYFPKCQGLFSWHHLYPHVATTSITDSHSMHARIKTCLPPRINDLSYQRYWLYCKNCTFSQWLFVMICERNLYANWVTENCLNLSSISIQYTSDFVLSLRYSAYTMVLYIG